MSRRHKENDIEQSEPHEAESQGDGSIIGKCFSIGSSNLLTKLNKLLREVGEPSNISYKMAEAISGAILRAFLKNKVVIDEDWVKIPRKSLESCGGNFMQIGLSDKSLLKAR